MHRIHALTDDVIDARVRIKRVWKGGGTARFEISVGLLTNGGPRYAASSSWTLATALHNAFESVENQLLSRREERHIGGHADHWRYADQVVLQ
jgi:hypothetical protein